MKLHVEGMTRQHCINGITRALTNLPGVQSIHIDPQTSQVTVGGTPDADLIREAIEDEGCDVISVDGAPD
jgi:copper chaperone CopZ